MPRKPSRSTRRNLPEHQFSQALAHLDQLRTAFTRESAREKLSLLRRLTSLSTLNHKLLISYHDHLCFLRAYPDSPELLALAEAELQRFGERVRRYRQMGRDTHAEKFEQSGMVNTPVYHPFSYDIITRLMKLYAGSLEIGWEWMGDEEPEALTNLFPLIMAWNENDAYDTDPNFTAQSYFEMARPQNSATSLETLLNLITGSAFPLPVRRHLYEAMELPVRWALEDSPASRTLARVPWKKTYFQTEPVLGRSKDLRAVLRKKLAPLQLLSRAEGEPMVQLANEVLAVRYRELYCLTHASPDEVYRYSPGRGVDIYVFGTAPGMRLPLEANYGALLVRNGLPVGYGVGAVLLDRVEIAINIFPAFRNGESAFIIEQFFTLFYQFFGSRLFVVRSRQMGNGDPEPIQSGAFWFYYKLGFRAMNSKVRNLSEAEAARLAKRSGSRSPVPMLRKLSKSDVFFHADPAKMNACTELPAGQLGYRVTDYFAATPSGDRIMESAKAARDLARRLGITGFRNWSRDERTAMERLAPLLLQIPDLASWSARGKKTLAAVVRAKGSPREREYTLGLIAHERLAAALWRLAQSE